MEIVRGSLVYSRAGRDKGKLFLVLAVEADSVYLTDGKTRRVEKPKKKKIRHINRTNIVADVGEDITNSDVRKTLSNVGR